MEGHTIDKIYTDFFNRIIGNKQFNKYKLIAVIHAYPESRSFNFALLGMFEKSIAILKDSTRDNFPEEIDFLVKHNFVVNQSLRKNN